VDSDDFRFGDVHHSGEVFSCEGSGGLMKIVMKVDGNLDGDWWESWLVFMGILTGFLGFL
jgi:hypothetical protein